MLTEHALKMVLKPLIDGLADIAAAIREHTAELLASEERSAARMKAADDESAGRADARLAPFNEAMRGMLERMAEMEAATERRQIESEGRADQRFAAMEKRMRDGGY